MFLAFCHSDKFIFWVRVVAGELEAIAPVFPIGSYLYAEQPGTSGLFIVLIENFDDFVHLRERIRE